MKRLAFSLLLVLNLLGVYSNHFRNDFQFDDLNAIPNNPAIRQSSTIFRAFADPNLFSSSPAQRTYRPLTTASLALDYWIAGGFNVFIFHLSTFIWFSALLILMFLLFEQLMNMADRHPSNFWTALAAAALFGFHPACAETINFIIQRSEVYNALGCVAGLWLFVRYPSQRRFGWYLIPVVLAILAKPPALVFPLLLLAYVLFFESRTGAQRWKSATLTVLPSFAVAVAAAIFLQRMQPHTWNPGTVSPGLYRLTQPWVALHYFQSFFLPIGLNVDAGWHYAAPFGLPAIAGYLFVILMLAVVFASSRTRPLQPVAFGLCWFLAALLPTSLMPLGDVTNDHRMFFAFVGLALAVIWILRLALFRATARLTRREELLHASVATLALVLILAAAGTRARNRVWLTHRSLWADSVAKNPRNERALANYGAVAYDEGDYQTAFNYWQRALDVNPGYASARGNIVLAASKLHRPDLVEHYLRSILDLYPSNPLGYSTYADWLASAGRFDEAVSVLDRARKFDPQNAQLKHTRSALLLKRDAAGHVLLIRTLDTDQDTRLSPAEIIAAPAALQSLDRDGDGSLTAEECGAHLDDVSHLSPAAVRAARLRFMRSNPVLLALDANHDGVISASEIRTADRALARLAAGRDGFVEASAMVPVYVRDAAASLMKQLDLDHDGRIEASEVHSDSLQSLICAAADEDGSATFEALVNELSYRADRDKDGIVTREELDVTMRTLLNTPSNRGPSPPSSQSAGLRH